MARKGNGYKPRNAVADAIVQCGWPPKVFFERAQIFTRTNGFDPAVAAKSFEEAEAEPPPAVIALANWVLVTTPRAIDDKFRSKR